MDGLGGGIGTVAVAREDPGPLDFEMAHAKGKHGPTAVVDHPHAVRQEREAEVAARKSAKKREVHP